MLNSDDRTAGAQSDPGPVPVYPEVLHVMSRQVPYDYDFAHQIFYDRGS